MIAPLILLLGVIINEISGACVKLTGSKSCPGFSNYSIDTTNGIFPLTSVPKYTDVTTFDSYVAKYADFLGRHFASELAANSTCTVSQIENDAVSNLRYLTTYACNFIIISKENTCQVNKPKVCKDTCSDFVASYQNLVNKYNNCLNQNVVSQQISQQNSRCTKGTSNFSATSNCVDSSNESNCGFKSASDKTTYCSTSNDSCCSGTKTTETSSVQAKPVATATSKTANVDNANESKKEQNEPKSGGSKLWIFIGIGCACLVIGALVYFYRKGEALDNGTNNSFYEQDNKFPPFQSSMSMSENRFNNSSGYSQQPNNFGNKNIYDNGDILINREVNNKIEDPMDNFHFGADQNKFNFTSNIAPQPIMSSTNDNNGFNNAALFTAGAAAAATAAAVGGVAAVNMANKENNEPKQQTVNMTNIEPPSEYEGTKNNTPIIKVEDEPKAQMVNMTNIQPPETQNRNDSDQPPEIKIDEDEVPKAQMVNMTEIPEPEVQQNRNTKFLSTYSEAPSNQRISSQFYGDSETSYDFSSSKLNIPSQLENHLSIASSALLSNRMSSSTDRELNSTPYRAVHTYEPQLNDELLLELNDIVEVVYIYDDGWVWGINTRTNESGACPMLCLEKVEGSETDYSSIDEKMKSTLSARDSMISRDSVPGRRDSRILKVDSITK